MNLQHSLENYFRHLALQHSQEIDPRLSCHTLDIHDLALLIQHRLQDIIHQQAIPALQITVHAIKEDTMAFIVLTIHGGLDDFPVYKPSIIKKWLKKGLPQQIEVIDSSWYSAEFKVLEKILNLVIERYNYATDHSHMAAKRYWTLSEIDMGYEELLMNKAVGVARQSDP